jgi:hypothetical protein
LPASRKRVKPFTIKKPSVTNLTKKKDEGRRSVQSLKPVTLNNNTNKTVNTFFIQPNLITVNQHGQSGDLYQNASQQFSHERLTEMLKRYNQRK